MSDPQIIDDAPSFAELIAGASLDHKLQALASFKDDLAAYNRSIKKVRAVISELESSIEESLLNNEQHSQPVNAELKESMTFKVNPVQFADALRAGQSMPWVTMRVSQSAIDEWLDVRDDDGNPLHTALPAGVSVDTKLKLSITKSSGNPTL